MKSLPSITTAMPAETASIPVIPTEAESIIPAIPTESANITTVMPAEAGIQVFKGLRVKILLDASLRWHDREGCNREVLS